MAVDVPKALLFAALPTGSVIFSLTDLLSTLLTLTHRQDTDDSSRFHSIFAPHVETFHPPLSPSNHIVCPKTTYSHLAYTIMEQVPEVDGIF